MFVASAIQDVTNASHYVTASHVVHVDRHNITLCVTRYWPRRGFQ